MCVVPKGSLYTGLTVVNDVHKLPYSFIWPFPEVYQIDDICLSTLGFEDAHLTEHFHLFLGLLVSQSHFQ